MVCQSNFYSYRIRFFIINIFYQAINKGEKYLSYNIKIWKSKGALEILNTISEHVTLVQFMDTVGNVNNAVSISGNWILDSNDEKALLLAKEAYEMIY